MIAYAVLAIFPSALLVAAANDIYEFKIPNWLNLILILAYPIGGFLIGMPASMVFEGLLLGAVFLALGFSLFALKIIGGGDAKLIAATAPWIGLSMIGAFLFYTAIAGLFLVLTVIAFRKLPVLPIYAHANWLLEFHQRKKDVPYGVAIATGGLLCFQKIPYFQFIFAG